MKIILEIGIWLVIIIINQIPILNAQTNACENGVVIKENTTWTKINSPYFIGCNLAFQADVTLTIEPGVIVIIDSLKKITIDGDLIVNGIEGDTIFFINDGDDKFDQINFNNIYNNTNINLRATKQASETINAKYNWWDTNNANEIAAKIYDYYDDGITVKVDYNPWSTQESYYPIIVETSVSDITMTTAQINATVNANSLPATVSVEYGLTTAYGNTIPTNPDSIIGTADTVVKASLSSLEAGMTYHYRIKITNTTATSYSADNTFTALPIFSEMTGISLTGVGGGSVDWGDYDNDGDLDILLTGMSGGAISKVYRNNGNNTFSDQTSINLIKLDDRSAKWSDYDNDGDLDIVLVGDAYTKVGTPSAKIYKNEGNNTFSIQNDIILTGVVGGAVDLGDYDNDGDRDIFIAGLYAFVNEISNVFSNEGNNTFLLQASINIPGLYLGSAQFGDFDNDNDLDLLVSGYPNSGNEITKIYCNNGNNNFSELYGTTLFGISSGAAEWVDYNCDGKMDIFLNGSSPIGEKSKIYKNNGDKTFTEQIDIVLIGTIGGSFHWGDFDNDGDLDILIVGSSDGAISKIYRNSGNNIFEEVSSISLPGVESSSVKWGDYDSDGDLDILLAGYSNSGAVTKIYRNNNITANSRPNVPTGLAASPTGKNVLLSWTSQGDAETPTPALTYNVRVGTKPDGFDIVSPHALTNGTLTKPEMGNAQLGTSHILKNLPFGTYYWSVQTVDNGFKGSEFSKLDTFNILPTSTFFIDTSVCINDTLEANYTGYGTDSSVFIWGFQDASFIDTSDLRHPRVSWDTPGIKKLSLIVIENEIESEITIDSIQVFGFPSPDFLLNIDKLCNLDTVIINYTGSGTTDATYSWSFDGGNIISGFGQGEYHVNWPTSGIKTISLSVEENGCASEIFEDTVFVYQPASDFTLDDVVCENQHTQISFNGTASDSAIFNWDFNSANIVSGYNFGPFEVNWDNLGEKIIKLTINDNGCISNTKIDTINHNPIPTADFIIPSQLCYENMATIIYNGTAPNSAEFNWNYDGGTIISGTNAGPYEIYWENAGLKTISLIVTENGCSSSSIKNVNVNQQTQPIEICMVSVDTSDHNLLIWNQLNDALYDSIFIYKETSQSNVYLKICSKSASESSLFSDLESNPGQNSSRYKLSVLDTCSYETPLSAYHKTMHLTINAGMNGTWNLIWDKYEGFSYSSFQIFRGSTGGSLTKIAEQASNTFTFTDLTPPLGTLYYQIVIVNPNPCNVNDSKTSKGYYESAKSNLVNTQEITSISSIETSKIEIYPNPVKDELIIEAYDDVERKFEIINISGQTVISSVCKRKAIIDISNLTNGTFYLKLNSGKSSITKMFVKQ